MGLDSVEDMFGADGLPMWEPRPGRAAERHQAVPKVEKRSASSSDLLRTPPKPPRQVDSVEKRNYIITNSGDGEALSDGELSEKFHRLAVDKRTAGFELMPNRGSSVGQPLNPHLALAGAPTGLSTGLEQRVLLKSTATQALPVSAFDRVLMHMVESSALLRAGATLVTTATGDDLQVPKSTAFGTTPATAEGVASAGADPTLAVTTLHASKYMGFFQLSHELAEDSESDLVGFLAAQAGLALAVAYGPVLMANVVAAAPTGVTGVTGMATSLGTQGTANEGTDALWALEASIADPYTLSPSCGFVMANSSLRIIHQLRATDGLPALPPTAHELLGFPVHVDASVPVMAANAHSILFGDFSHVFVRIAGGIRFDRSDGFNFNQDLIAFRAAVRIDGNLIDTNAVKAFVNSAT